jgi:hypothetical protein
MPPACLWRPGRRARPDRGARLRCPWRALQACAGAATPCVQRRRRQHLLAAVASQWASSRAWRPAPRGPRARAAAPQPLCGRQCQLRAQCGARCPAPSQASSRTAGPVAGRCLRSRSSLPSCQQLRRATSAATSAASASAPPPPWRRAALRSLPASSARLLPSGGAIIQAPPLCWCESGWLGSRDSLRAQQSKDCAVLRGSVLVLSHACADQLVICPSLAACAMQGTLAEESEEQEESEQED